MAGTYSQVYIQIVFAVKGRKNLISKDWKEDLNKYIAGIIKGKGQKPIIVNGMPDHIHAFLGLRPVMAISDMARDIKNNSSKFINDNKWLNGKFSWQEGYGAFSYSHSHIEAVYNYIKNQEEHHKKKSFCEEYLELLKNLRLNTMKNICLIGLNNLMSPLRGYDLFCIHFIIIMSALRAEFKKNSYDQ